MFDLDGTLLDTAPDLMSAINRALQEAGFERQPANRLKPLISHGAAAMLQSGMPGTEPRFERLLERALTLYQDNVAVHTRLFDGMAGVLDEIERRGLAWGIVTNKLARFTDPLVRALGLRDRAGCIVSGDTTPRSKPHPLPLTEGCRRIGLDPGQCVYVGDAGSDIAAGRSAGMLTLVALYGYIGTDDTPEAWGADDTIDRPLALLDWLNAHIAH